MGTRFQHGLFAFGGFAVLATGGLLGPSAGCSATADGGAPDDAGPFEGGGDAGASTCATCVVAECTGEWSVCLLDPACRAMRACASASRDACACTGDTNANRAYAMFASCNDARTCAKCASDCSAQCAGGGAKTAPSCGGVVDASADAADAGDAAPAPMGAEACSACIAARCGDPKRACALGTECASFLSCTDACGDAACAEDCGRRFASGRELAVELSNCTLAGCRSSCGL